MRLLAASYWRMPGGFLRQDRNLRETTAVSPARAPSATILIVGTDGHVGRYQRQQRARLCAGRRLNEICHATKSPRTRTISTTQPGGGVNGIHVTSTPAFPQVPGRVSGAPTMSVAKLPVALRILPGSAQIAKTASADNKELGVSRLILSLWQ